MKFVLFILSQYYRMSKTKIVSIETETLSRTVLIIFSLQDKRNAKKKPNFQKVISLKYASQQQIFILLQKL
jgi:hypothetical protein